MLTVARLVVSENPIIKGQSRTHYILGYTDARTLRNREFSITAMFTMTS